MVRFVSGHDQTVARFVNAMIPHAERDFGAACKAIGIIDDRNELIAGAVFHDFFPKAGVICISGAALPGTRWLTRETMRVVFDYCFKQCQCQMVLMRVLADHESLLRQLAVIGFSFVTVPRLYGREHDGVICTLTVEDWAASRFNRKPRDPLDIPDFLDRRNKEAA